jgi:hypothetical protein
MDPIFSEEEKLHSSSPSSSPAAAQTRQHQHLQQGDYDACVIYQSTFHVEYVKLSFVFTNNLTVY